MTSDADAPAAARRLDLLTDLSGDLHTALADGERALSADGDLRASRPSFERAYQLAELAGDVPALAVAAIGLAGLWVSERRTMTGAVMLESRLQDVLGRLPASSPLALRIRARLAAEADYREGEHARVMQVLDEARAAADPVPLAEALSLAHHCLLGPGHIRQRRELATELIGVSFRTGQRSDRMMGLLWQTVDSYAEGDPHAGRLLGELRSLLSEHDHAAVSFVVSAIEVMLAIRAGRLEDAESLANVCATSGAAAGDIDSEWWPGAQLVTVRWYQGRLAELQPMLSERVNSPVLSAVDNSAVAALAVAAAQAGDRRTAASCLATLRGPDLGRLPQSSSWLVTMNGVAEAAYTLGDAETAALVYDVLAPFSQIPLVGGLGVTCFGSAHQALGIACLTARQPDRAVGHLRSAVQHNLALAHWPAVVSARQRLAEAYGLRSGPDDDSAAREELSAAAAEAAALGIPGPVQPSRAALSLTHPGRSPETRPRENPARERPARIRPARIRMRRVRVDRGRLCRAGATGFCRMGRRLSRLRPGWPKVAAHARGSQRAGRGQHRDAAPCRPDRQPAPGHPGRRARGRPQRARPDRQRCRHRASRPGQPRRQRVPDSPRPAGRDDHRAGVVRFARAGRTGPGGARLDHRTASECRRTQRTFACVP